MANNMVFNDAWTLEVACSEPAVPNGGDPVRFGFLTGVAVDDENAAGITVVDFGQKVWSLAVTDRVGGGIAVGDTLFYASATDDIDNVTTGTPFGYALEAIGAGLAATILVLHVPGHGAATLGAGVVGAANIAAGAVTAGKIAVGGVSAANQIVVDILTGTHVDQCANDDTTAGILVVHPVTIAGGAAGNEDVTIDDKVRVIDVVCVHTAGAGEVGDTIQLFNGAGAITDAMDWSGADQVVVRPATIDDAACEIAAGGTLRVTTTDADAGADVGAGVVYVTCMKVA